MSPSVTALSERPLAPPAAPPVSDGGTEEAGTGVRIGSKWTGGVALLGAADVATVAGHGIWAAHALVLLVTLTVPGAVILAALGIRLQRPMSHAAAMVATSLVVLMLWGVAASEFLSHLGVTHPLARGPDLVALNVTVVAALAWYRGDDDPVLSLVSFPKLARSHALWAGGAVLLPLLSALGAERLNNGQGSAVATIALVLTIASLLTVVVRANRMPAWLLGVLVYSAALAVLLSFSLRGDRLYGFDIQSEYQRFLHTYAMSRWVAPSNGDAYQAMLSITALPAVLARLSGMSGLYLLKAVYPMVFALVPAVVFESALRWFTVRASAVCAVYLVILPQFGSEFTAVSRQEIALLFFAVFLAAVADPGLSRRHRESILVGCLAGMVVSHYSTSYLAVLLMAATWLGYALIRAVTHWRPRHIAHWRPHHMAHRRHHHMAHRRPHHYPAPLIPLSAVLAGIVLIGVWDVGITHSTSNVAQVYRSIVDEGVAVLPNGQGGSIIQRWLAGNVNEQVSPSKYYAEAERTSALTQPWLDPYPPTVTSHYPAKAAPVQTLPSVVPGVRAVATTGGTVGAELLLVLFVGGAVGCCVVRRRGVPVELCILALATVAVLAFIRVSGTAAVAYNQERSQFQGLMVLFLGLGWVTSEVERMVGKGRGNRRLVRVPVTLGLCLLLGVSAASNSGLANELGGGNANVNLANKGVSYDAFAISNQEATAAGWLFTQLGPGAEIFTDEYGGLRIWDGSPYTAPPYQLLTPATIDRGAWVFASRYNLAGRTYGQVESSQSTYAFPEGFLADNADTVYSSPQSRIYLVPRS